MLEPGRSYATFTYGYGYQGSNKDDELQGTGNIYTTEFRQYSSRLGNWFSVDPKFFAFGSNYSYALGCPVIFNDKYGDTAYYFNSDGVFLRVDPQLKINNQNGIIILSKLEVKSQLKSAGTFYAFNDQKLDRSRMDYMINNYKDKKLVYLMSEEDIKNAMVKAGTDQKMDITKRFKYAKNESDRGAGKMDFFTHQLAPEALNNGLNLDVLGSDQGPFYIFNNQQYKVYNLMDAGNWLWGHAMKTLDFTYTSAQWFSEGYSQYRHHEWDPSPDQEAIGNGYFYDSKSSAEPIKHEDK